jgi:16S rRNA (uracil1498-N3)-methyltransferase
VPHVLFVPNMPSAQASPTPTEVVVGGDEARHALRVRRLAAGDGVLLANGAGLLAPAIIASTRKLGKDGWELTARLDVPPHEHPRPAPSLHVCTAFPKGDLLEHMLDQLSQCGVAAVSSLRTQYVSDDDRPSRTQRLERICEESLKQARRPWLMQLGAPLSFAEALQHKGPVLLADATGESWPAVAQRLITLSIPPGVDIRVLVGPEGGFSPTELAQAREARATLVRATPHILRIETAAVVLAGLVLATLAPLPGATRSTLSA